MKHWKTIIVAGMAAFAVATSASAPASASHEHYLVTPGTCVADIASGQTEKTDGEGGYHQFHHNVHKGQPGMEAFANPNNPVSVEKGLCPAE